MLLISYRYLYYPPAGHKIKLKDTSKLIVPLLVYILYSK